MCIYFRVVFECDHEAWGQRVKLCTVGEAYSKDELPHDCLIRTPHGLQSVKVSQECGLCCDVEGKLNELKGKLDDLKAKLEECRQGYKENTPEDEPGKSSEAPES